LTSQRLKNDFIKNFLFFENFKFCQYAAIPESGWLTKIWVEKLCEKIIGGG
jgi:hypothetical protein